MLAAAQDGADDDCLMADEHDASAAADHRDSVGHVDFGNGVRVIRVTSGAGSQFQQQRVHIVSAVSSSGVGSAATSGASTVDAPPASDRRTRVRMMAMLTSSSETAELRMAPNRASSPTSAVDVAVTSGDHVLQVQTNNENRKEESC